MYSNLNDILEEIQELENKVRSEMKRREGNIRTGDPSAGEN